MKMLHLKPKWARVLLLIAGMQISLSSSYPFNQGISQAQQLTECFAESPRATHTVHQISDGQIQVAAHFDDSTEYASVPPAVYACSSTSSSVTLHGRQLSYSASSITARDILTTETTLETVFSTTRALVTEFNFVTVLADDTTSSTSTTDPVLLSTSIPDGSLTTLTTSAVQTATASPPLDTSGSVLTSLETSGAPSSLPFPTSIVNATSSLSLVDTSTLASVRPLETSAVTTIQASNIFQPIATDNPATLIGARSDHPVARTGIAPQQKRLQTNKFYGNFYLGTQTAPVFLFPYSVNWVKGTGATGSQGLAVSHIEPNQWAAGPARDGVDAGSWEYYVNPLGIQSLILSAIELGTQTTLTTDTLEAFSVNANLLASVGASPTVIFPLVQGSSLITGIYRQATPLIQSSVGFSNVTYMGTVATGLTHKYTALLENGYTWVIYVTPSDPAYAVNSFTLANEAVQGPSNFNGYIQVAKLPGNAAADAQSVYDNSAGAYPISASISGTVDGTSGSYTLSWTKQGIQSQELLMFALPHHLTSFDYATIAGRTNIQLMTTVKGIATAIRGDSWTLNEPNLPINMSFAPWTPTLGSIKTVSAMAASAINAAGTSELAQNISAQTNVGSLYYDGKALAKFAAIVYALYDIAENHTLALTGLQLLQQAFALHVNNQMTWPLVYDDAWGGAVSSETYIDGNSGDEFGNTYYNDHHFHYGYFVYAASVIGYIDPTWLQDTKNVAWVNMLVRDYANSATDDASFPFSRMFDWYHGHSWAGGLFESFDGKNQESSSEDTMASYALKMWGQVINDQNMEARGNLMLAVQARSLQSYYLYTSSNTVEPAQFIGNKVAGILFENKIDHTTYFGASPPLVQGIHMLPLMPFSTLTRTPQFVMEEWNAYNWSSTIDTVVGGWKGILLANYAIVNPEYSYQVFLNATGQFGMQFLDGGASQTWYLTWAAALGGDAAQGGGDRV